MSKNEKLTDKEILAHYIKMGEALSEMFKPNLEVIIHDLRFPEHSIIAIFNSQVTGRKVGEGTSDLGYKKVEGKVPDKVINYKNKSPDGKPLKSSSLTIRNSTNQIIGSLGLNFDITIFEEFGRALSYFTGTENNPITNDSEVFFYGSTKEEIGIAIKHYRTSNGLTNNELSKNEKYDVIEFLIKAGHLNKRGAVPIISDSLAITRPTVYKYIKEVKKKFSL